MGLESCEMMRRFRIWLQDLNRITFDPPPFWQKTDKINDYAIYDSFLAKNVVKCYQI